MDRERFPITLWPGVPVPMPEVEVGTLVVERDGWVVRGASTIVMTRELPAELVLHELQDLGSDPLDEALLEYMQWHGVLGPTLPFEEAHSLGPAPPPPIAEPDRRSWLEHMGRPPGAVTTLEVAGRRLKELRCLTGSWVAFVEDGYVAPVWAAEGFAVHSESDAWELFAAVINRGLRGYTMSAELAAGRPEHGWVRVMDGFAASCVQLANLINENVPPHRCANERCGRAFVRQRGGAEQGQYRLSGVKYCTPTCQRAQGQREWRRRQRASKQGGRS